MPLKSHKAVLAGVDKLAGRALGRAAKAYRRKTIDPLVRAMEKAKSYEGLKRALSAQRLQDMDPEPMAEALASAGVNAALIGRTAATLPITRSPDRESGSPLRSDAGS